MDEGSIHKTLGDLRDRGGDYRSERRERDARIVEGLGSIIALVVASPFLYVAFLTADRQLWEGDNPFDLFVAILSVLVLVLAGRESNSLPQLIAILVVGATLAAAAGISQHKKSRAEMHKLITNMDLGINFPRGNW